MNAVTILLMRLKDALGDAGKTAITRGELEEIEKHIAALNVIAVRERHFWVSNSGRGGDPNFRLNRQMSPRPLMHVCCALTNTRTWVTQEQWVALIKDGQATNDALGVAKPYRTWSFEIPCAGGCGRVWEAYDEFAFDAWIDAASANEYWKDREDYDSEDDEAAWKEITGKPYCPDCAQLRPVAREKSGG